jgi:hypothetical protein
VTTWEGYTVISNFIYKKYIEMVQHDMLHHFCGFVVAYALELKYCNKYIKMVQHDMLHHYNVFVVRDYSTNIIPSYPIFALVKI